MARWSTVLACVLVAACAAPGPKDPAAASDLEIADPPVVEPPPVRELVVVPPPPPRQFTGRRVDVTFRNADVHNALRFLGEIGQINLVVAGEVGGQVNLRLRNVPWDQVFYLVAEENGAQVRRDGAVYYVSRRR